MKVYCYLEKSVHKLGAFFVVLSKIGLSLTRKPIFHLLMTMGARLIMILSPRSTDVLCFFLGWLGKITYMEEVYFVHPKPTLDRTFDTIDNIDLPTANKFMRIFTE